MIKIIFNYSDQKDLVKKAGFHVHVYQCHPQKITSFVLNGIVMLKCQRYFFKKDERIIILYNFYRHLLKFVFYLVFFSSKTKNKWIDWINMCEILSKRNSYPRLNEQLRFLLKAEKLCYKSIKNYLDYQIAL
jgi:hypothetical protein